MNTKTFVGETGPDGCVRFGCRKRGVIERTTKVKHPGSDAYLIVSKHCEDHSTPPNKWHYPNFEIVKEVSLDSSS